MKKLIATSILILSVSLFYSQEKTKTREYSLIMYDLKNYGLLIKTSKKENKFWRFRLFTAGYRTQSEYTNNNTRVENKNMGLNFSFGKERRTPLNEKLHFIYGAELTSGFNHARSITSWQNHVVGGQRTNVLNGGLTGVLGLNYLLNEKIIFGLEVLPSAIYTRSETAPYVSTSSIKINNDFNIGFGNNSILFSLGIKL